MNKRESGVLLHLSSLHGPYGTGCFGKEARAFIDFLHQAGFKVWQVLPFSLPDEGGSPYKSVSAFAGNPYFIDPEQLFEQQLITEEELKSCRGTQPYTVDFPWLHAQRTALFHRAYLRCSQELLAQVDQFASEQPWAEDFALYTALQQKSGKDWYDWEPALKNREPEALAKAKSELRAEMQEILFIQYLFFSQWAALRAYANERGIQIIGDIPIYVSLESADVWSNRRLFQLDDEGQPRSVAGVPPDFFSEDGQRWGNPLYDWDKMEQEDFLWWRRRIRSALTLYDRVRIDHFRGLSAYWAVPAKAETAKEGHWIQGPGMKLLERLFKEFSPDALIAEDLGVRDKELETLLKESGLPGMRVFQFAFPSQDGGLHLPHNYPENTLCYTGTHDNNTLLAYLWELPPEQRREALEYCGFLGEDWQSGGAENAAIRAILRCLWCSAARTVVVPVQDLLGYGGDTKMNRPGVAEGNWQFRLTSIGFSQLNPATYRKLNRIYER